MLKEQKMLPSLWKLKDSFLMNAGGCVLGTRAILSQNFTCAMRGSIMQIAMREGNSLHST